MAKLTEPTYLADPRIVNRTLHGIRQPTYDDTGGFFAYEDGAFVCNSSLNRATEFTDDTELLRAWMYAKHERRITMVPVVLDIALEPTEDLSDPDRLIRREALNKLTNDEKRALGVG